MKAILIALALIAITACTALGLTAPKGFDQQLANAYGTHTAVVKGTASALTAGSITSQEASEVQKQANSARALLDLAKSEETAGNAAGSQKDLALAVTSLNALQAFVQKGSK